MTRPYQHPSARSGGPPTQFFDLTVPEHAYLFGLLQTDGSHSAGERNKGRIQLEVGVVDIDVLRHLQAMCPWYTSVKERTRNTNFKTAYKTATWTLCSWDARKELTALGLPPGRKAKRIVRPDVRMSERDYLRGLMDGDGSVGFTGEGLPFASFVTASEAMARYWEQFVLRITGTKRHSNPTRRDNVYNPMVTYEAAAQLANELYQPGDLALGRKATSAALVAAWRRPPGMRPPVQRRRWTSEEDDEIRSGQHISDIAQRLDRSENSVQIRRWRLLGPGSQRTIAEQAGSAESYGAGEPLARSLIPAPGSGFGEVLADEVDPLL